jgi:hypothetical protein
MPNLDESREAERGSDAIAQSDDFAARIAAVVFEWRLARACTTPSSSHERSPSSVRWMSRNTRGRDVTS